MIKNLSLAVALLIFIEVTAQAQSVTYKPFRVDITLGADIFQSNSAALAFTVEPHYRIMDAFAIGLRFQDAVNASKSSSGTDLNAYTSVCMSGDYYITPATNPTSFFVGGGIGDYTQFDTKSNQTDNFGFFPRIGIETSHFRGSLEYNVTGGNKGYFAISAGWYIGGGKR